MSSFTQAVVLLCVVIFTEAQFGSNNYAAWGGGVKSPNTGTKNGDSGTKNGGTRWNPNTKQPPTGVKNGYGPYRPNNPGTKNPNPSVGVKVPPNNPSNSSVTPKNGTCLTWGGVHFKTFDNKFYTFHSTCQHILVREIREHKYIVTMQRKSCGNIFQCPVDLTIYLEDESYKLTTKEDGSVIFRDTEGLISIPASLPEIQVSMVGAQVLIRHEALGISIKWDTKDVVQIDASILQWSNTEGLCGSLDGNPDNDLTTKDGKIVKSAAVLAASWQINKIGEICQTPPTVPDTCSAVKRLDAAQPGRLEAQQAERYCLNVLSTEKFRRCAQIMDVWQFVNTCKWDYCACASTNTSRECACRALSAYAQGCVALGVEALKSWRDAKTCPVSCPSGKVYQSCGPETQPSCAFPLASSRGDIPSCVEGCFCPEGLLLEGGKCVPRNQCPCRLRDTSFPPGHIVSKDCNTCTCKDGKWSCTTKVCGARCRAVGDPHYTTFDGLRYDFMGKCTYTMMQTDNVTVEVQNEACSGSISEAMHLAPVKTAGGPSCTKAVTIKYAGANILLSQGGSISVNGKKITNLPVTTGDVRIRLASSLFLIVQLPNKVDVWWDGNTRVFIDVPPEFMGKTKGLCGTYNKNQKDDFLTPENDVEQSSAAFANKWRTKEFCSESSTPEPEHPCAANLENREPAEKYCSKLKGKVFKACHAYVDVTPYYDSCMYDMCACEGNVTACLCPTFGDYAMECAKSGVMLQWRYDVQECELQCSGGQEYTVCADSCSRKCSDAALEGAQCSSTCAEGCACKTGELLDESGVCVPVAECPCSYDGMQFQTGYKEVRAGRREQELCTCVGAGWDCVPAKPDDIPKYPPAGDLRSNCSAIAHMEFTTCAISEPRTCKNMHLPPSMSLTECRPGCQCKKGYVLDASNKRCVPATACPCHHGGVSYADGHVLRQECNDCVCKSGNWTCTKNKCAGVCSVWGDSHITTFDGSDYEFEGVCTYLLAKGKLDTNDGFTVEIENVPCGTTGATCSKSLTLKVGSGSSEEIVTLTKNAPLPELSKLKRIKLRIAGSYVFLDVPSLGVTVQWDRQKRAYLKVDPKWAGRVKGLCGNYNGDLRDDFQGPAGGLAESSAFVFVDSWKLKSVCPPAKPVPDHCRERPERRTWAAATCGALNLHPFSLCHAEVPVRAWVQRCERDTCACDAGGDCECTCEVLAAYAAECADRGVTLHWRSQDLCPMQCDEENTRYDGCVSACPQETCDNTHNYNEIKSICERDNCVEGCKPKKVCADGTVFRNASSTECLQRAKCNVCMTSPDGTPIAEGGVVTEDKCHRCICSKHQLVCTGQPCSTETPPVTPPTQQTTPTQNEQPWKCVNGWTPWLSQSTPQIGSNGFSEELEPLPKPKDLQLGFAMCLPEMMTNIECRTVGSHRSPKATGLDVECSLERGLVCKDKVACPDFEIRVKCLCTEVPPQTTTHIPGNPTQTTTENPEETPSTTQPTTKNPGVTPNTTQPTTEKPGVTPSTIQPTTKYPPGLTPNATQPTTKNPGVTPNTTQPTTENPGVTPSTIQPTTKYPPGLTPNATQPTTKNPGVTPNRTQPTTEKPGVTPSTIQPTTKYPPGLTPNATQPTTKNPGVTPNTTQPTTENPGVTPSTIQPTTKYPPGLTPNATQPTTKNPGVTPNTTQSTTENPGVTPNTTQPTTENPGVTPNTTCPPGQQYRACVYPCEQLCDSFKKTLMQKGRCIGKEKCVEGCVPTICAAGRFWRDERSCVQKDDCPCLYNGNIIQPGAVVTDVDGCQTCQCLHNEFQCDSSDCASIVVTPTTPTIPSLPLYGCAPKDLISLLWDSETLPASSFTASSVSDNMHLPQYAVLDGQNDDVNGASWTPASDDSAPYIQVELLRRQLVYGVEVQGSPNEDQYVTSYQVLYGDDGKTFTTVKGPDGKPMIFDGPKSSEDVSRAIISPSVLAKFVRIRPLSWHGKPTVRIDVLGCIAPHTTTPNISTTPSTGGPTTKPPGSGTTRPPGNGTTVPPGGQTTKPPGNGTTVPPGGPTTKPPGSGTTVPPGGPTTMPPGSGTTVPPGGQTTKPPGNGTTVPPGGPTTMPPGGPTTVPPGGPTTKPPGSGTTLPPGGPTTKPPGSGTTVPPGGQTTKPPGNGTTVPPGGPTTMPPGSGTTLPPGGPTTKPPGSGTTVPPGGQTTKPPGNGTTVPPGGPTTMPPGSGTTLPPGGPTTKPPGSGTTVPPGGPTTKPPGSGTTVPPGGQTTKPPGNGTTVPPGGPTTMPPGGPTTVPPGGPTTKPPGNGTTVPPGGQTTKPPGNDTTVPPGGPTTMPPGGPTTMPPGGPTTKPPGSGTTLPPGGPTTVPPGGPTTVPPGGPTTVPPGGPTTNPPGSGTTLPPGGPTTNPPGSGTTLPPGGPTTKPPGSGTTVPPGGQTTKPPGNGTTVPPGGPTTMPPGGPTTMPPGGPTTVPPGGPTTKPPGSGTTVPPGGPTTMPPGGPTTVPPGGPTTKPPGSGTTMPPGGQTTKPPGNGTTVPPGGPTTMPPGGPTTVPPGGPTTNPPGNGTTVPPGGPTTMPPGGPTTMPPGGPTTVPPGGPTTKPPGSGTTLPPGGPTTKPPGTGTTLPPGGPTTQPPTTPECPEAKCPPGYRVSFTSPRPRNPWWQSILPWRNEKSNPGNTKGGNTKGGGTKGGSPPGQVYVPVPSPEPTPAPAQECPPFRCVPAFPPRPPHSPPVPCPAASCPPGYTARLDYINYGYNDACPQYVCLPTPEPPGVCTVMGRTIYMFDGFQFKYDVCDHTLAREISFNAWTVNIRKKCFPSGCWNELLIRQDDQVFIVKPSLMIEYNYYEYSVEQIAKISFQMNSFDIIRIGNAVRFQSRKYAFRVVFNQQGDVKIQVLQSLRGGVVGLCGDFTGRNVLSLPDGTVTTSIQQFGTAWARPGLRPDACLITETNTTTIIKIKKFCEIIMQESFSACGSAVNLATWHEICVEKVVSCSALVVAGVRRSEEQCRCLVLEQLVAECLAKDRTVDISGWRVATDCMANCPAPLVSHDCYRKVCEPTCSFGASVVCPMEEGECFPGCYCPEGMVRQGDTCTTPPDCHDCVCTGGGSPALYVTFEGENYYKPPPGYCTYLVSQDRSVNGQYKYQVYATNGPCDDNPSATCVKAVHLLYKNDVIHVTKDNVTKQLVTTIGSTPVFKYPVRKAGVAITLDNGRDISISLPEAYVELTVLQWKMEFTVRVPSYLYGNKTEGLCGVCLDKSVRTGDVMTADEFNKYALTWTASVKVLTTLNLPPKEQCKTPPPPPACVPPPRPSNPCYILNNRERFGKCHALVDPQPFIKSCEAELCNNGTNQQTSVCSSLERYAAVCRSQGVCLDQWRTGLCPYQCESPMVYRSCVSCERTCENNDDLTKNPSRCNKEAVEGCFCPEGKVRVNSTCVEPQRCFPCDANNEHFVGEQWQENACTQCTCSRVPGERAAHVACTTESCTTPVCGAGQDLTTQPAAPGRCCPTYVCGTKPINKNCLEPKRIVCGFGQVLKEKIGADNCTVFSCECKPASECEDVPPVSQVKLEPGMERVIDRSGCCPREQLLCKKDKCPKPEACPRFHTLQTQQDDGKCCPTNKCVPPKNKCVARLEWESSPTGGEKRRPVPEDTLKDIDTIWFDGPCRSCRCTMEGSSVVGSCSMTSCPEAIPNPLFVTELQPVPYSCCPALVYTGCRYGDRVYKEGQSWQTSDPCKKLTCSRDVTGRLAHSEKVESCVQECERGWVYRRPTAGVCCGRCVQDQCVFEGLLKKPGSTWQSADNCTTYACDRDGEQVNLSSLRQTCPDVSHCDPKHIINGTCCARCELPSHNQKTCYVEEVPKHTTVGMVRKQFPMHGLCVNKNPVPGFKECRGICESSTHYDSITGTQKRRCECCAATKEETLEVTLTCADGFNQLHQLPSATACSCLLCNTASNDTRTEPGNPGTKNPPKNPVTTTPSNSGTKNPVTTPPSNLGTKNPVTTTPSSSGTKNPVTTPPSNSGTKNPVTTPPSNSGTKNPVITPPSNSGTKNPVTTPPGNSETKNPVTTPPSISGTKNPVTTPPSNSGTKNPVTTPPSNSGTKNPVTTPSSNSGTKNPPNNGNPDMSSESSEEGSSEESGELNGGNNPGNSGTKNPPKNPVITPPGNSGTKNPPKNPVITPPGDSGTKTPPNNGNPDMSSESSEEGSSEESGELNGGNNPGNSGTKNPPKNPVITPPGNSGTKNPPKNPVITPPGNSGTKTPPNNGNPDMSSESSEEGSSEESGELNGGNNPGNSGTKNPPKNPVITPPGNSGTKNPPKNPVITPPGNSGTKTPPNNGNPDMSSESSEEGSSEESGELNGGNNPGNSGTKNPPKNPVITPPGNSGTKNPPKNPVITPPGNSGTKNPPNNGNPDMSSESSEEGSSGSEEYEDDY